jgi:hypothetical protein
MMLLIVQSVTLAIAIALSIFSLVNVFAAASESIKANYETITIIVAILTGISWSVFYFLVQL